MRFPSLALSAVVLLGSAAAHAQAPATMVVPEPEYVPGPEYVDEPSCGHGDAMTLFVFGTAGVILGGINATFTVYDGVVAGDGELPSLGWAIAETAVMVPEATLLNLLAAAGCEDNDCGLPIAAGILPFAAWSTGLATHGIWAITALESGAAPDPRALLGASMMVGTNLALTTALVRRTVSGRLHTAPVAVAEMIGAAPSVAIGAYQSATTESDRAGWIGLTAWSGALFLHGGVSLAAALAGDDGCDHGCGDAALPVTITPTAIAGAPGIAIAGNL